MHRSSIINPITSKTLLNLLLHLHFITLKGPTGGSPAAAALAGRERLARSVAAVQHGGFVRRHGRGDRRAAAELVRWALGIFGFHGVMPKVWIRRFTLWLCQNSYGKWP